jgi:hypothetical protein
VIKCNNNLYTCEEQKRPEKKSEDRNAIKKKKPRKS